MDELVPLLIACIAMVATIAVNIYIRRVRRQIEETWARTAETWRRVAETYAEIADVKRGEDQ